MEFLHSRVDCSCLMVCFDSIWSACFHSCSECFPKLAGLEDTMNMPFLDIFKQYKYILIYWRNLLNVQTNSKILSGLMKDLEKTLSGPTSCSPNTFNSASCKPVALRPYHVSKVTCGSVDSYGILLWNLTLSCLEDLFVFQKIHILHKDSFTQYSGEVKSLFWKALK